jgi:hypothetical protein
LYLYTISKSKVRKMDLIIEMNELREKLKKAKDKVKIKAGCIGRTFNVKTSDIECFWFYDEKFKLIFLFEKMKFEKMKDDLFFKRVEIVKEQFFGATLSGYVKPSKNERWKSQDSVIYILDSNLRMKGLPKEYDGCEEDDEDEDLSEESDEHKGDEKKEQPKSEEFKETQKEVLATLIKAQQEYDERRKQRKKDRKHQIKKLED